MIFSGKFYRSYDDILFQAYQFKHSFITAHASKKSFIINLISKITCITVDKAYKFCEINGFRSDSMNFRVEFKLLNITVYEQYLISKQTYTSKTHSKNSWYNF